MESEITTILVEVCVKTKKYVFFRNLRILLCTVVNLLGFDEFGWFLVDLDGFWWIWMGFEWIGAGFGEFGWVLDGFLSTRTSKIMLFIQ